MSDTIVVFTRKTIDEILDAGGSQYWRLQPANARPMTYLVCARNVKGSDGLEAHGAGFLIGRISGVVPTPEEPGRYLIQINEWAKIDCPDLWTFGRNPVHYLDLADLDIDPADIDFQPLPEHEAPQIAFEQWQNDGAGHHRTSEARLGAIAWRKPQCGADNNLVVNDIREPQ